MPLTARIDDLTSVEAQELVGEHLRGMHATSPPGHVNAFAIDALKQPEVTFWSVWDGSALCGCGALKELSALSGEIKSMRTRSHYSRRGVGQYVPDVITETAMARGYRQLFLETGTGEAFEPAQRLYRKNGFVSCAAFGEYVATDFNMFMLKNLHDEQRACR